MPTDEFGRALPRDHEMFGVFEGAAVRGVGAEIRVYGVDPDAIEARVRPGGLCLRARKSNLPLRYPWPGGKFHFFEALSARQNRILTLLASNCS